MQTQKLTQLSLVAAFACLCVATARADVHFGIIATVRTTPKTTASINVASDQPGEAVFTVFPSGGFAISDSVGLNLDGFATSADSADPAIQNLFIGSSASTALVRAVFANGNSTAVLEQSSLEGKSVVVLPPYNAGTGTVFQIPIGDLQRGTSVIIGNVSDFDTAIVVRYGNDPLEPPVPLSKNSTLVIDVTQANTLIRVVSVLADARLIALLTVDTGKTTEMTYVLPQAAAQ